MSTRAIQIESLLTGLVHPTTGLQMTGGTAYFYSAGTSNAKNVWTEKEKTNPYTSYALSVIGGAQLYGDGEYKIVVKDADGVTCYTWDNVRLRYPNYYVRAVTATTSQTADDDFLEVNTTTNPVTINMLTVASWVQPLKIMHTAGANAITLEPSGAELVDGAANYTFTSVGTIVEIVADAAGTGLRKAGIRSTTLDADGDTGIELDRTADNDTIYIKTSGVDNVSIAQNTVTISTGGVDRMVINSTATDVNALSVGGVLQTNLAKLQAVAGTAIVDTSTAQNIGGAKTFTAGLSVTGAPLKLANSAEFATITGDTATQTVTELLAGGYTSGNDSGRVVVRSKNHASLPGTSSGYGTNGTTAIEGWRVLQDGTFNVPVGLQIGGVDQAKSGVFVSNANGNPNISDTNIVITSVIVASTWESVGPTGSGADNIWTALNSVPADADWIEVFLYVSVVKNTGTQGDGSLHVFARKYGSAEALDVNKNSIGIVYCRGGTTTPGTAGIMTTAKIPVVSGVFDIRYLNTTADSVSSHMRLSGYGHN